MARDIDLYINSSFCGFWPLDKIEEYFLEYSQKAEALSEYIDWDEIILYAVLCYDGDKQTFLSADFMLIRMDYSRYIELNSKISGNCRMFFKRNKY
ncbi:MAG: hypothetical protein IJX77_00200 [Ruminococcus sp.]|nr:hypothetical protein [Ruminococcus sp.]